MPSTFVANTPEALRMRVGVMSKMRGVDSFAKLWKRCTTIELPDGTKRDLLSLPDLVQAKKAQRHKYWPMIRRLVEAHYFSHKDKPNTTQIKFWLMELRTPQLLLAVAKTHSSLALQLAAKRPPFRSAASGKLAELESALVIEESNLRAEDNAYRSPLLTELESLRHPK